MSFFNFSKLLGREVAASNELPVARAAELIVEEIEDEILVYDGRTHRAHCLGADAARVWRACDGSRTAADLPAAAGLDEATVARALEELQECELLESPGPAVAGLTRRDFAKVGAGVAVSAPLIYSVAAPSARAAQTEFVTCNCSGAGGTASLPCDTHTDCSDCLKSRCSSDRLRSHCCTASFSAPITRVDEVQNVRNPTGTAATGVGVHWTHVSPNGMWLATGNFTSGDVSMFRINADGTLTAVPGSPFTVSSGSIWAVEWTPNSMWLAASSTTGTVTMFPVTQTGVNAGALGTSPAPAGIPAGSSPTGFAFNRAGTYMAVADRTGNAISVFSVNQSAPPAPGAGTLTPVSGSPFRATTGNQFSVTSVVYSPDGRFLYASSPNFPASPANGAVQIFSVNQTTGALTYVTSVTGNGQAGSWDVAISPAGDLLAVANSGRTTSSAAGQGTPTRNTVSLFTVNTATGALTAAGTITTGNFAHGVTLAQSPCGLLLGVGAFSPSTSSINVFLVNPAACTASTGTAAAGCATNLPGSPTGPGNGSSAKHVDFTPDGRFMYSANWWSSQASPTGTPSGLDSNFGSSVSAFGSVCNTIITCVRNCNDCTPARITACCAPGITIPASGSVVCNPPNPP